MDIEKGSSDHRQGHVGTISRGALKEIAETKLTDLNAASVEGAMAIIEGTARSMGIKVSEE